MGITKIKKVYWGIFSKTPYQPKGKNILGDKGNEKSY